MPWFSRLCGEGISTRRGGGPPTARPREAARARPRMSTARPRLPVAEGWVQVLVADGDLAARLPAATVAAACPFAVAPLLWLQPGSRRAGVPPLLWLEPGSWRPEPPPCEHGTAHMGFLVLDGFFARRVDVVGRPATEL